MQYKQGRRIKMDFVQVFLDAMSVMFSPYFLPYLSLGSILDALFSIIHSSL